MEKTEKKSTAEKSGSLEKVFGIAASHPYLCAFAVCILLTPFFFGSLWEMPSYTIPAALAVLIAFAAVFIWSVCREKKLPVVTTVLLIVASTAALALGANAFSRSDYKVLWIFLTGCLLLAALYGSLYKPGLKRQFNSALILGMSFLIKFCYVLCTDTSTRQHDIGSFNTDETTGGHLGYIAYLYKNHSLYQDDYRSFFQYCHPPFHHSVCAVWITIWKDVFHVSQERAVESLEMLTLFYSVSIAVSAYFIFRHFGLDGKSLYIPLMIAAFHPCFIYLSAFLNNDALMWALVMGAVLATLRWYKNPSLKGIMKISLCIGLGMMTKLSAALVAPPVAMVFLAVFIREFRTSWKKLIGQFAAFGAVCVPLGMWFPVRGFLRWKVPLTYVQELSESLDQNIRSLPFLKRITDFGPYQVKRVFENWVWRDSNDNPYGFNESNPLIAIFKNSVFSEHIGEQDFKGMDYMIPVCTALFWIGVAVAVFAFIAMLFAFISDRSEDMIQKLFIASFHVMLVGNLYLMSAKYPMVCTMNFRYLMPTVITGALFAGLFMKRKNSKAADSVLTVTASGLSALSVLVYIVVAQNS